MAVVFYEMFSGGDRRSSSSFHPLLLSGCEPFHVHTNLDDVQEFILNGMKPETPPHCPVHL
jgi:hypothetical protein